MLIEAALHPLLVFFGIALFIAHGLEELADVFGEFLAKRVGKHGDEGDEFKVVLIDLSFSR